MLTREAIAHVATPWEWRSRTRVVGLVVTSAVLFGVGVVLAAQRSAANAVFNAVILGLIFVLPAVRSLRRWDHVHRSPAAP